MKFRRVRTLFAGRPVGSRFEPVSIGKSEAGHKQAPPVVAAHPEQIANWHCPHCGTRMELQQAFTAAELLCRCPVLDSS